MATEEAGNQYQHHMAIPWHDFVTDDNVTPARAANIVERSAIVGRIGLMMLGCGTGAWRVRNSMNVAAETLGMTCSADIGLVSIEYTCMDHHRSYTQALSLPGTGVNTARLNALENYVRDFEKNGHDWTTGEIHQALNKIEHIGGLYAPWMVGLTAALACSAFVFLLGGGPVEMLCSFCGAGLGNFVRRKMIDHKLTLFACIAVAVAAACVTYAGCFSLVLHFLHVNSHHEAGYIGAMLFVIPGFPFITSGLDLSKLDMRSGLERGAFALIVITVATLVGWVVAMVMHLQPENFIPLALSPLTYLLLRLVFSFCGVFGFSIMFNSSPKMAATAGLIGALANTLRLEMVDLWNVPAGPAAFTGALLAGLLASLARSRVGYPRIAITVPSIVIMVPGLYMYSAVYNIGLNSLNIGATWMAKAALIIVFLPLGLIAARIITDPKWRYKS